MEFADLHNDLFFIGKNFGKKLDKKKFAGISLVFDTDFMWLEVGWNKRKTVVPVTNVGNMTFPDNEIVAAVAAVASIVTPRSGAQASSPTEHVFAGPGAGKTK